MYPEMVSFATLRLFRDIAHTKSISRGASLNQITPSAASQQVQDLERNLGMALLDRSTRPLALTPAGKLYYEMCRDVLRRNEELEVRLQGLRGEVEGTVRVASIYSVGLSEMSELEAEFARRAPQARLQVEYLRPERVYAAVIGEQADLGLVSYPEARRELVVLPWRSEEMAVATGPQHPLARRDSVSAHDLDGCEFISFDEDLPIRREVDRYLREQGVTVDVVMHFDNLQMIKEAVALHSGVSILPARILRDDLAMGRLCAVPLTSPGLFRPLGIIHRKRRKFGAAAQVFLELLQTAPEATLVAVRR